MRQNAKILFTLLIIMILSTACDSSCSESKNIHFYVKGNTGASLADISYRQPGGELIQLYDVSLDWFNKNSDKSGSYTLCVQNKSGTGSVEAVIHVTLTESCDGSGFFDIDPEGYEDGSSTQSKPSKKISAEDNSYVCVNYIN